MFCDFLPENEVRQIDPAQLSHVWQAPLAPLPRFRRGVMLGIPRA